MKISKLKKLRLKTAYYIICIVIDIVLVSVALTGFLVYFQDKADIPLVLVLSVNAVTLAFITVSVGGYVKGMSVGRAVLYKAISFFFFFGLSFTAYDYGLPAYRAFRNHANVSWTAGFPPAHDCAVSHAGTGRL